MTMTTAVGATNLEGLTRIHQGKVRDLYTFQEAEHADTMLLVATDRVSAYDVVLDPPIPDKGRVLTQLSLYWFKTLQGIMPDHIVTADIDAMPPSAHKHRAVLAGRAVQVRRLKMLPIECVVRGYLVGSGWKDYQRTGTVCGHELPKGLSVGARLDPPIFTPATKAVEGHDENISRERAAEIVGGELAAQAEARSLVLYSRAREVAAERGIVIADTKVEMGLDEHKQLVLADEVFTPDSSRFWDANELEKAQAAAKTPPSYDKQRVRDWLDAAGWDHAPPAPVLPADVVADTTRTYREIYERLTGSPLGD